ncbi:DUF1156 domain-containing protein, partial [bacterium]|nr:DUF1156 domain-containing protein [bacterium]
MHMWWARRPLVLSSGRRSSMTPQAIRSC